MVMTMLKAKTLQKNAGVNVIAAVASGVEMAKQPHAAQISNEGHT